MIRRLVLASTGLLRVNLLKLPKENTLPRYFSINLSFLLNMKIGTHDGVFHCDEALACYMLKRLPQFSAAEIVRTRDPEKLQQCDIVVDVGGEFDHEKKRYDHHQREFVESLSSLKPHLGDKYKIKLSSAGLVYAFYGEELIQSYIPKDTSLSPEDLQIIFRKVYENLIEEVDAIDNGVPIIDGEPNYIIHTHLSKRVARLKPEWNSKQEVNMDEIFEKAMTLVGEELTYVINYFISVWLPARVHVNNAIDDRYQVHESGQIIEFTEFVPWQSHLFDIESEGDIEKILYVIFSDKADSWRVQAVPVEPSSFVLRKPLHQDWLGKRNEELSSIAEIPDCIFCHSTGFIGGNKTREGALQMAIASLKS